MICEAGRYFKKSCVGDRAIEMSQTVSGKYFSSFNFPLRVYLFKYYIWTGFWRCIVDFLQFLYFYIPNWDTGIMRFLYSLNFQKFWSWNWDYHIKSHNHTSEKGLFLQIFPEGLTESWYTVFLYNRMTWWECLRSRTFIYLVII